MLFSDVRQKIVTLSKSNVRDEDTAALQEELSFLPVVAVTKCKIDGSINVTASLDPRETWINGIFENSRYFRMSLSLDGKVTWGAFVRVNGGERIKARACRVKSLGQFADKVRVYAQKAVN